MATLTNTLITSTPNVGVREDLENDVYRIAPEETPFTGAIGKGKATNTYHEWQTRTLRTPNPANAQFEGNTNNTSITAPNTTTRVGNYTQIFTETGSVSETQQAVNTAGRADELDEQKMLKGITLKTDIEAALLANRPSAQEVTGTSARSMAGAPAWITTNTSRGTGGASGGFANGVVTAATNGAQRTPTEALYKQVLSTAFANGVKFKAAIMGGAIKQEMSAFTGIAQQRRETGDKMATIIGAVEVYVSDFGNQSFVPHMYALPRDILLYDPDMLAVGTLRAMSTEPLAKIGDSDQFQVVAEKTLVVKNQKALGIIADLS